MKRALVAIACIACVGTTGGALVDFPASAAGAADATSPLLFDETTTTGHTWHVELDSAKLHVGALYLDQAQSVSGAGATQCILPGTYVAEVLDGLDVDLLSPTPQPFPAPGHGATTPALVGQVWLTGGDVNAVDDATEILVVSGVARDDAGATVPFSGTITIGKNRLPSGEATGADPICKERIVSPIQTTIAVEPRGSLVLRVDARRLFSNVDFSALVGGAFSDDPSLADYTQPSINLFANLHSTGPYTFEWAP